MPNAETKKLHYNSVYHHGIDDKRRVQIPVKWRPAELETEFTLILWPNGTLTEACLLVLPPAEMDALAEKIRGMSYADPKASALRRLLGGKSATVTVDKAGRICLPDFMAKAVGIDSEAVLVGLVDRFEIWEPARYEAAKVADAVLLPEAFKMI
jgi:transcriptional regulator MraZ